MQRRDEPEPVRDTCPHRTTWRYSAACLSMAWCRAQSASVGGTEFLKDGYKRTPRKWKVLVGAGRKTPGRCNRARGAAFPIRRKKDYITQKGSAIIYSASMDRTCASL